MYCADTSSWIAFLSGASGGDIPQIESCLHDRSLLMAPTVLAELLSDPALPSEAEKALLRIPLMELTSGFWERAGKTRAILIRLKMKPKLADTLIAQVCIDHQVTLHARDADFRPFVKYGLQLRLHGNVN